MGTKKVYTTVNWDETPENVKEKIRTVLNRMRDYHENEYLQRKNQGGQKGGMLLPAIRVPKKENPYKFVKFPCYADQIVDLQNDCEGDLIIFAEIPLEEEEGRTYPIVLINPMLSGRGINYLDENGEPQGIEKSAIQAKSGSLKAIENLIKGTTTRERVAGKVAEVKEPAAHAFRTSMGFAKKAGVVGMSAAKKTVDAFGKGAKAVDSHNNSLFPPRNTGEGTLSDHNNRLFQPRNTGEGTLSDHNNRLFQPRNTGKSTWNDHNNRLFQSRNSDEQK